MAPNYSFFCLLFSNGAQPRKPRLPLSECFDSDCKGLFSCTNTTSKVSKPLPVPSCPPCTPRVLQGRILSHQDPLHCFGSCHGPRWENSLPRSLFPRVLCLSQQRAPSSEGCGEMVLLSQTSNSTLGFYWKAKIKAGQKGLIHPWDPLRAPGATALGFPDPKLVSLVALGGFFFLEFLELVPDPVSAFHLSWQFPVASVLLSSWGGQMA